MLRTLSLCALAIPAFAQPELYATGNLASSYVVGSRPAASGLFYRTPAGTWEHPGYNLPILSTITFDPHTPDAVFIAAGNGLIRATNHGTRWTILTGSDVTELRDVIIDNNGAIYFAYVHGIRMSRDNGKTWTEIATHLRRKFTESLRIAKDGALIAGTEDGLWRSTDSGKSWQLAGASGFQIMRLEASPQDGCRLLAAAQQGGLWSSRDCGRTFENAGSLGVGRNLYDIAFDPTQAGRIAVAGFGPGVAVSTDDGKTWTLRNSGIAVHEATSVIFDPTHSGRLYAAILNDAVYVSDDAGVTWTKAGMEGSHITCLRFRTEVRP